MTGRFAGPFNLFRGADARERLVKNYAAKLLANAERIVDRPGGSKVQKLVSQHGDLLFTAMVDKTGPRPLYRVFVAGLPPQIVTEEQVEALEVILLFLETGGYSVRYLFSELTPAYAEFYIGTPVEQAYINGFGPNGKISLPSFTGSIDSVAWLDGDPSTKAPNLTALAAAYYVPASSFSGKLRLYVQALYGAKRTDYLVDANADWAALYVNGIEIEYTSAGSHWLYTTEDYKYYLCRLSGSDLNASTLTFEFRELTVLDGFGEPAEFLRQELVTGYPGLHQAPSANISSNQAVIEGLLLSVLEPSTDVYQTVAVTAPSSGDVPFGSFLGYGWHATYGGSTVKGITHYTDLASYGVANHAITLTVSNTWLEEPGSDRQAIFAASASASSSSSMKVQNDIFVWIPDGSTSSNLWLTEKFYFCGPMTGTPVIIDPPEFWTDYELYGWYDEDDTWVPATISREDAGNNGLPTSRTGVLFCGPGEADRAWSSSSPSFTEYSVSVRDDDRSVMSFTNEDLTAAHWTASRGGYTETNSVKQALNIYTFNGCPSDYPTFTGFSIFQTYCFDADWGVYGWDQVRLNGLTQVGRVMFSLVLGDCDSAVYGAHEGIDGDTSYKDAETWEPDVSETQWPLVVTDIKRYSGGSCHESLWGSESNNRREFSLASLPPTTTPETFYPNDSDSVYLAFQNKVPSINVMHDEANGDGSGGYYAAGILDLLDSYGVLPPGLPVNSNYAADLVVLFEPPTEICITGDRSVSQTGVALTSSVSGSISATGSGELGTQMESLNTDTYPTIDTFCGWA